MVVGDITGEVQRRKVKKPIPSNLELCDFDARRANEVLGREERLLFSGHNVAGSRTKAKVQWLHEYIFVLSNDTLHRFTYAHNFSHTLSLVERSDGDFFLTRRAQAHPRFLNGDYQDTKLF